jgi:hypothetical protein
MAALNYFPPALTRLCIAKQNGGKLRKRVLIDYRELRAALRLSSWATRATRCPGRDSSDRKARRRTSHETAQRDASAKEKTLYVTSPCCTVCPRG